MLPRFLLDTHVAVRWLGDSRKLSREQVRVIRAAARNNQALGLSAVSLLEIALLTSGGRLKLTAADVFELLQANPMFRILPVTYEIALEVGYLASLKDPADQVIVATARVHHLSLLTSDQRIIDSKLVRVVE